MKVIGDYMVLSKIGSGSFATVWKAIHMQTGECVAIKAISREKLARDHRLQSEIDILLSIDHPNIVKLLAVHRSQRHIYLVLEYCEQDLGAYLTVLARPLTEPEARGLMQQLVSGLGFLHERNLAHRDLKPQNLLVDHAQVLKIADFGFARNTGPEALAETVCGSPLYMAPEILRSDLYDAKVADLWSAGAILYEMVTGTPPYQAASTGELLRTIERRAVTFPSALSGNCRAVIQGLLGRDPATRLSLSDLHRHPFFHQDLEETDDLAPRSDFFAVLGAVLELAEEVRDDPELALVLFSKALSMLIANRRTDPRLAKKSDQIAARCQKLLSATNLDRSATLRNPDQYIYSRCLRMAREAAVGELMGDATDQTLTQLRKTILLLQDVANSVMDSVDRAAIRQLIHHIQLRIMTLISRDSTANR